MCGLVGLVSHTEVNQDLYDALLVLQHRGQDAAGIATCDRNRIFLQKGNGFVRDVFRGRDIQKLAGNTGIGHVRYPTAGAFSEVEAQPFYVNSPFGIALTHNGNLTNAETLKTELWQTDRRHINTESDSEILLNILAHELQTSSTAFSPSELFAAVRRVHQRCRGAYAVVAMIMGHGVLGFRDLHGIRPLVFGQRTTPQGVEYMIASESVALNALGFKLIRDLAPGEAIFIDLNGDLYTDTVTTSLAHCPCIFEYVYLARADSVIEGISVYGSHIRMGEKLADKIASEGLCDQIDVVIPVPDTSRPVALQLSSILHLPYREGFIKNRYIGRTFIMPGQVARCRSVRQKLNAIESEFKDHCVLLVDDSIVRGTTSQQIIQMARDAGAKKVFFASASPPIRFPNVYGIDMPAANELIAYNRSIEDVRRTIGADGLVYQDLSDLESAIRSANPKITHFESSIFDGHYVTGDVDAAYLTRLAEARSESSRQKHLQNW